MTRRPVTGPLPAFCSALIGCLVRKSHTVTVPSSLPAQTEEQHLTWCKLVSSDGADQQDKPATPAVITLASTLASSLSTHLPTTLDSVQDIAVLRGKQQIA